MAFDEDEPDRETTVIVADPIDAGMLTSSILSTSALWTAVSRASGNDRLVSCSTADSTYEIMILIAVFNFHIKDLDELNSQIESLYCKMYFT